MQAMRFSIEGDNLGELPPHLARFLGFRGKSREYYLRSQNGRHVLAGEKYYLRADSTLLSVVIITTTGDRSCDIEVITGGARAGLFSVAWGAEQHRNREIAEDIEFICDEHSWSLVAQAPAETRRHCRPAGA